MRATEQVKAEVSGESWLKQKRWDKKWECSAEIVRSLGELHSNLAELSTLEQIGADAGETERKARAVDEAMMKANAFGSIARIAVAPSVRTVLTRFGDAWNKSTSYKERGDRRSMGLARHQGHREQRPLRRAS